MRRHFEYIVKRHGSDKAHRDLIKILMSNAYVTKLIGIGKLGLIEGGQYIRDIAARACGAQVKIISKPEQERELQDCIVTIAGNLANRQDALCIVLESIEDFRKSEVCHIDDQGSQREEK